MSTIKYIVLFFLLVIVSGTAYAEKASNEARNPFINGTINISGMHVSEFAKAVTSYETSQQMQPSSQKEISLLFSSFDTDGNGVIDSEESDGAIHGMKAAKKKKGGKGGGSAEVDHCEYNTCNCDTQGAGVTLDPSGGGDTNGGISDNGGSSNSDRSPSWCGAHCHCHCNTLTCAPNGT